MSYYISMIFLIITLFKFNNHATFSETPNNVIIRYRDDIEMWNALFFNSNGEKYKTLDIDSTSIGAINTFLLEAGENSKIDVFSPISFVVAIQNPFQGISPLNGQTIDFHNNITEIKNPQKLRMNGIHMLRKHNVTIKNFRLEGYVTYGIWAKGCNNFTIHNLDIDISRENGIGVFIRPNGNYRPHNLTISGDVYINGGRGHAIEFTSIDTVSIGDVTVSNNIAGCGINVSGSTHVTIGNIYGYKNCYNLEGKGGGYATLRYSNAGEYLECKGVYSRRCGRGYMITQGNYSALPGVLGQHFSTVRVVDIKHTVKQNIFIRGTIPTNNQVLSGTVSQSYFMADNPIFVEGKTNKVSIGIPETPIDTHKVKEVRINELQFGFYDLTSDEQSENYIRDRSCDGFGYAKTIDDLGVFMEWNIKSGNGNHNFNWRYSCQESKKAKLLLNGKFIGIIDFSGKPSVSKPIWQTITLNIKGIEASEFKNLKLIALQDKGLPLIDYLEVEAPGAICSLKNAVTSKDSTKVSFKNR